MFLPGQFQFTVFQPEDRASVMLALLGKIPAYHPFHDIGNTDPGCSPSVHRNAPDIFRCRCTQIPAYRSEAVQHFFVFLPFFLILNSGTEIFNAKGRKSQAVMGSKCRKYIGRRHGVTSRLRNQKWAALFGIFFAHSVKIRQINVRRKDINVRRCFFPYRYISGNGASAWIISGTVPET